MMGKQRSLFFGVILSESDGAQGAVSSAFVKETDESFDSLPDRPVSKHPNLVTSAGLEQIDATLARLHKERAVAQVANDRAALARIARDLRYWSSRKSTARVIHAPKDSGVVHFGCTVIIAREDGSQQSYRIVGEDEADPSCGTVSYTSPLAQALIGKQIGDAARVGSYEAEIVEIRPFEDLSRHV